MESSRQEHWSGLPFPTPEDLSNSGIKPTALAPAALASEFFPTVPPGKTQSKNSQVQLHQTKKFLSSKKKYQQSKKSNLQNGRIYLQTITVWG